jgi:hypothetical protein
MTKYRQFTYNVRFFNIVSGYILHVENRIEFIVEFFCRGFQVFQRFFFGFTVCKALFMIAQVSVIFTVGRTFYYM